MKYLICKMLLIGILFTNYTVFAQLDKEWEARYMQTGYLDDAAKKVIADENGNSYVLGNSGDDAVLIKYDSDGNLIWSFQAGRGVFMEDDYDAGRDFQIGPSGNIYVVLKGRHEGTYGVSLLKLNNDGELLQHTHMPGAHREGRVSLAIHDDGSLSILSRSGYRGIRLLKLTNTGEEVWSKTFSTSDRSYVQEVRIINNMIVAWYYSGLQTWFRESYLHVYSLDGDLKWEHNYKYESYGTHITGLQLHEEEFIVSYYMNEGASQGFNQIMRYDMSDGTINKSFNVQLDYTFESDEPVSVMYVGDDSFIYLMGDTFLQVRKYSLEGERIWFYEFEWASGTRHHPIAFTVNENDSSANVLIRTEYFNNPQDTYRLVKFNADKTYNVLANIRGLQKDFIPVSFTQTGSDFLVAGAFDNGVFEKDLLVAKFTKTNARIWEASFEPVNSERHEPTCMVLDEDGNVYVGGRVAVGPKSNGFGLIKYSPTGEQLWATTLVPDEKNGSQEAYRTMITALDLTPDGNIVATGVVQLGDGRFIIDTPVEMYTTKINSDGEILWTSKTSSEDDNHLIGLQVVVDDNNIYTLGSACQFNRNDDEASPMVLVKYDLSGNEIWERRFFFSSCHSNIGDSHLPDSQRPLIEVVNDKIYVVSTKFKKLELRTFDTDGNETLIKELGCSECHRQFYYVHGLHIEPSGDIYLAYGDYQPYKEFQGTVTKLSPTGATIWSTTRSYDDENTFPYDGSFAFDNSNNIYLINASPTELNYSKIDPEGNEIWTKSELLKGHSLDFGHPVFTFVKSDGNPVFLSTNQDSNESKYYFSSVRDQSTGEIIDSQIFDEKYDTYDDIAYRRPGDQLVAFAKDPDSDDFFVSGVIQDKYRSSETIVTFKYSTLDVVPPSRPMDLAISRVEEGLSLSWNASVDNKGELSTYNIYKNQLLIGQVTNTTFTDSEIMCNESYSYSISATDLDGNESAQSNIADYFEPCPEVVLSVSDEEKSGITIYPNPTTSILHIESNDIIKKLKLVNAKGMEVVNTNPNSHKLDISIENIKAGIYYLLLISGSESVNRKIIIE